MAVGSKGMKMDWPTSFTRKFAVLKIDCYCFIVTIFFISVGVVFEFEGTSFRLRSDQIIHEAGNDDADGGE